MFRVYANASLNISAAAARSSTEGIFTSSNHDRHFRASLLSIPCHSKRLDVSGIADLRIQMHGNGPWRILPDQPLHKRAWVLQESVLSPRRVDFGAYESYWECRTATHTEGYPISADGDTFFDASGRQLQLMEPVNLGTNPEINWGPHPQNALAWWYRMLGNAYFGRGITKHEDLLPALAGVAETVAKLVGYSYRAGLWLEDMQRGLLWQSASSLRRPDDTPVPSWSWASTQLPWYTSGLELHRYSTTTQKAEIIEVNVKNSGGNDFGQVLSGSLRLKTRFKPLAQMLGVNEPVYNQAGNMFTTMRMNNRWQAAEDVGVYASPPHGKLLCTLDEHPKDASDCHTRLVNRGAVCVQLAGYIHRDRREAPPRRGEYVTNWKEPEVVTIFGLLLEPTGTSKSEFKRIGIVEEAEEDGISLDWDVKIITIV